MDGVLLGVVLPGVVLVGVVAVAAVVVVVVLLLLVVHFPACSPQRSPSPAATSAPNRPDTSYSM
jgi:hypothetical protein